MKTVKLSHINYYDEGCTVLIDWEAEAFVMDNYSYDMSNDIAIVVVSGISPQIWVGEKQFSSNQPMWDAVEYAQQYNDKKV